MVKLWKGTLGMEGKRWPFSYDWSGGSLKRQHFSFFFSNALAFVLLVSLASHHHGCLDQLPYSLSPHSSFRHGGQLLFLHASIKLWQDSMIELWKEAVGRLSWKWPFSYDGSGGSFKREHPFWHLFFYQMPLTSPLLASSALSLLTVLTSTFLTPSFQFTQLLAQGPIHFLHLLIRNKNVWASCVLVHSFACSLICFKDI